MDKYYISIKKEKSPKKDKRKYSGEMMILNYMNNNILISHLSYLVVYQYEYENQELYQEIIYILG